MLGAGGGVSADGRVIQILPRQSKKESFSGSSRLGQEREGGV